MPPAAPASISSRRSLGGSRSSRPRSDPNPAPICAIGPSCPAEPPVPMVMIDATPLISGTRRPDLPAAAVEGPDHGVGPVPLGLGGQVKTSSPEIRPPTVGTSRTSHQG